MRKLLMSAVVVAATTIAVNAQRVEVPQEFIDTANKSFMEVVLLRQAVASLEAASKAKDETIAAKSETISLQNKALEAKDETIKIRDEQIETYRKLKCDTTSFFFGLIKNKRCH